jgi:hypothetical protein
MTDRRRARGARAYRSLFRHAPAPTTLAIVCPRDKFVKRTLRNGRYTDVVLVPFDPDADQAIVFYYVFRYAQPQPQPIGGATLQRIHECGGYQVRAGEPCGPLARPARHTHCVVPLCAFEPDRHQPGGSPYGSEFSNSSLPSFSSRAPSLATSADDEPEGWQLPGWHVGRLTWFFPLTTQRCADILVARLLADDPSCWARDAMAERLVAFHQDNYDLLVDQALNVPDSPSAPADVGLRWTVGLLGALLMWARPCPDQAAVDRWVEFETAVWSRIVASPRLALPTALMSVGLLTNAAAAEPPAVDPDSDPDPDAELMAIEDIVGGPGPGTDHRPAAGFSAGPDDGLPTAKGPAGDGTDSIDFYGGRTVWEWLAGRRPPDVWPAGGGLVRVTAHAVRTEVLPRVWRTMLEALVCDGGRSPHPRWPDVHTDVQRAWRRLYGQGGGGLRWGLDHWLWRAAVSAGTWNELGAAALSSRLRNGTPRDGSGQRKRACGRADGRRAAVPLPGEPTADIEEVHRSGAVAPCMWALYERMHSGRDHLRYSERFQWAIGMLSAGYGPDTVIDEMHRLFTGPCNVTAEKWRESNYDDDIRQLHAKAAAGQMQAPGCRWMIERPDSGGCPFARAPLADVRRLVGERLPADTALRSLVVERLVGDTRAAREHRDGDGREEAVRAVCRSACTLGVRRNVGDFYSPARLTRFLMGPAASTGRPSLAAASSKIVMMPPARSSSSSA